MILSLYKRRPGPASGSQVGFTLIELLVTLTILAILAAASAPSFSDFIERSRIRSYADDLASAFRIARGEAIKRNDVVKVCASSNGTSCGSTDGWEQGWIVLAGSTVIQRRSAISSGYRIAASAASLDFKPSAVGATVTALTVCRGNPDGAQERVVSINATGRVRVTKTYTGACPD
ncbi:prepilin-type cleavage/methylation domain-containing protein [Pseudomonas taiwanensis]|uniref:GspH/FimT family pseudopilin n=1 Tax=Pseudomonas taiwanensis TaxID=470150 RepID=UPI0015BF2F6B|nr:GspH/FimT family pseudopilin [Pseudomonas taiwanensis]NWL75505.1 prepilin-type cleavage/methylation domain-containing protein [Pseudomonas taiwanensis]